MRRVTQREARPRSGSPVRKAPRSAVEKGDHPCAPMAIRVLRTVTAETNEWASGRVLGAAWRRVTGQAVPQEISGRWTRVFEGPLRDGRVVVRQAGRQQVYALAETARRLGQGATSDFARLEIALKRAYERADGAIPLEAVVAEIESDPDLAMQVGTTSVATRLIRLAREQRVNRVQVKGSTNARWYYAPVGARGIIGKDVKVVMDRRMMAIRGLWRASGGRPFTTRAIAQYAAASPRWCIDDDPAYGWTNALQHLATLGVLVRVSAPGSDFHVRWAIATEWEVLSAKERGERLADQLERDALLADRRDSEEFLAHSATPTSLRHSSRARATPCTLPMITTSERRDHAMRHALDHAPFLPGMKVDVACVSRARDVAALVAEAQTRSAKRLGAECAVAEGTETAAQPATDVAGLRDRPVTQRDIEAVREDHPLLLPRHASLRRALYDACRVRADMRRSAIVHVGTVRNTAYFAISASPVATAYVALQAALADADVDHWQHVASDIHRDADLSGGRVLPVPDSLLAARAMSLAVEADESERMLRAVQHDAVLTPRESRDVEERLRHLRQIRQSVQRVAERFRADETARPQVSGAHRAPPSTRIDVALAEKQFRGIHEYRLGNPRTLWTRLVHTVRVLREREQGFTSGGENAMSRDDVCSAPDVHAKADGRGVSVAVSGRPVRTYLDRVGFAMWVLFRAGGPTCAGLAGQAQAMLGEWRSVEFIVSLLETAPPPAHAGLCAALAFFDDVTARDALVAYVHRTLKDGELQTPHGADDDAWDAPVWRVTASKATSLAALGTAVLGLGRRPCGGLATDLRAVERAALEHVRESCADSYAGVAAQTVLRGWEAGWTREQWLAL